MKKQTAFVFKEERRMCVLCLERAVLVFFWMLHVDISFLCDGYFFGPVSYRLLPLPLEAQV